jgi:hypothetical protein
MLASKSRAAGSSRPPVGFPLGLSSEKGEKDRGVRAMRLEEAALGVPGRVGELVNLDHLPEELVEQPAARLAGELPGAGKRELALLGCVESV